MLRGGPERLDFDATASTFQSCGGSGAGVYADIQPHFFLYHNFVISK